MKSLSDRLRLKENRATAQIHQRITGTVRQQVDNQVWFPTFDKQEAQDMRVYAAYFYLFDNLQYGLECT